MDGEPLKKAEVDILLPTFNGADFLKPQLDSIIQQAHNNWRLLVRDDMSTDDTMAILREYQEAYPEQIVILQDAKGRLGVKKNFGELMRHASSDYIMFCDQDDVWSPHKIPVSLRRMRETESSVGRETPVLIHTDMQVVDADLQEISPSFWKDLQLDPGKNSFRYLIVQNNINGCTMLINRALCSKALPLPEEATMHDWWVAIVAAAFGTIEFINTPLVQYRQHADNSIGARRVNWLVLIKKNLFRSLSGIILQERAFARQYNKNAESRLSLVMRKIYYNLARF